MSVEVNDASLALMIVSWPDERSPLGDRFTLPLPMESRSRHGSISHEGVLREAGLLS
jgi:hypothetical protein